MAAEIDSLEIKITASSKDASDAISRLVSSLEKLDEALQKLNIKGFSESVKKISDSMEKMGKSAAKTGANLENTAKKTDLISKALRSATSSSGSFISGLKNIIPHAKSLTSVFMGLYAKLWLVRKLFNAGLKAITYASDLTEVENVVAHTFENMSYKLEDFAKTSRESFGLSELSAKTYASQFQAMLKTMGITTDQVSAANKSMAKDTVQMASMMSKGYEVVSNDVSDMSINLTKLAADMASFYNQETANVASRLQAGIISGQSRALRQYGIDLTVATLNEYALSKGIRQNVTDMTQAQKTMLRYQYAMERLSHVQGDFARTINTWHNQIVLLKQNLQALGGIIGQGLINAFKPAIIKLNSAMNTIIKLVEKAMNAIGKLLGWQIEIQEVGTALDDLDEALGVGGGSGGGGSGDLADDVEDAADGADDLAGGLDDAADAAKKLKDYTFGIDELNIFKPDDLEETADALDDIADNAKKANAATGSGSGGGATGGGSGAAAGVTGGGVTFKPYESDIESWYELGSKISEAIADGLDSIDWRSIQSKAEAAAKNLGELLNGAIDNVHLWQSIGRTIANGLATALIFVDTLVETVHWFNLGYGLAEMINTGVRDFTTGLIGQTIADLLNGAVQFFLGLGWHLDAKALGESLAKEINKFFEKFDFKLLATTINTWVDKLSEFIGSFLKNLDTATIFNGLKEFFMNLEPDTVLKIVGLAVTLSAWRLGLAIAKVFIAELIKTFSEKLLTMNLLKKIGEVIKGLLKGEIALDFTQVTFIAQGFAFSGPVNAMLDKFTELLKGGTPDALYDWLEYTGTGAWLGLTIGTLIAPGIGTLVGAILGALTGGLVDGLTDQSPMEFIDSLVAWLKNGVETHVENIKEVGKKIASGTLDGIIDGIELALQMNPFSAPFQGILDAMFDALRALLGIGEEGGEATELATIGESAVDGIASGIEDGEGSLTDAFDAVMGDFTQNHVTPWFQNEEDGTGGFSWKQLGIYALEGIGKGLKDSTALGKLWDAAVWVAGKVKSAFTSEEAFDEHSPSKAMEEIGKYAVEGLLLPFDSFSQTMKILVFALQFLSTVRSFLKPESFETIGSEAVGGIITGMSEALEESVPVLQELVAQYMDEFLYTSLPEFGAILFEEILPPYFGLEKWEPLFAIMHEMFTTKLAEFRNWWSNEAMTVWWTNDVKPWFTWGKWNPDVFNPVKTSREKAWEMFINWWRESLESWWNENVIPWFLHDKWMEQFMHIYEVAEETFTKVEEVIAERMEEARQACEEACNAMMEMIEAVSEALDGLMSAISSAAGMVSSLGGSMTIGVQGFAAGGYPSTGSLFYANEAGPELIGTINGNTAVANNNEITGIREAVYQTGQAETQLLGQIISIAQALLDKDPVVLGDRDIAEASNRGQGLLGLSLIS